jgi:hypothetical protein
VSFARLTDLLRERIELARQQLQLRALVAQALASAVALVP